MEEANRPAVARAVAVAVAAQAIDGMRVQQPEEARRSRVLGQPFHGERVRGGAGRGRHPRDDRLGGGGGLGRRWWRGSGSRAGAEGASVGAGFAAVSSSGTARAGGGRRTTCGRRHDGAGAGRALRGAGGGASAGASSGTPSRSRRSISEKRGGAPGTRRAEDTSTAPRRAVARESSRRAPCDQCAVSPTRTSDAQADREHDTGKLKRCQTPSLPRGPSAL
jgi:hypothetical protein